MTKYTIVLDAMGGDNAPQAPVEGALMALEKDPALSLVLTGKKPVLEELLKGRTYDAERLHIVHTEEVVENEEHSPAEAVKKKKDSSLAVAMRMVKSREVDGLVSAGNTGAVLSGATLLVGRIRGVLRPALTLVLPTGNPPVMVLDVGANMDAKPAYLVQFARMSSIYYRHLYDTEKPRVALLNVGVEEGKGNEVVKEVYNLLKEEEKINFIGNIEARDVMLGAADIVVTDAFAGNVLLKTIEGTAQFIMNTLKEEAYSSTRNKLGAVMMKPALRNLKRRLDPTLIGGTPMLGINGAVIKAHGNSNGQSIASAIGQCARFIATGVNQEIAENIK